MIVRPTSLFPEHGRLVRNFHRLLENRSHFNDQFFQPETMTIPYQINSTPGESQYAVVLTPP